MGKATAKIKSSNRDNLKNPQCQIPKAVPQQSLGLKPHKLASSSNTTSNPSSMTNSPNSI